MHSKHLSKYLTMLWMAAYGLYGADSITNINGPFAPTNLPGGANFLSSPAAGGEIGKAGGVTWFFTDIPMAGSNGTALWWGPTNKGIKLSFIDNLYRTNETLAFSLVDSELTNGRAVWRGTTLLGGSPAYTRFTLTFSHQWLLGNSGANTVLDLGQALDQTNMAWTTYGSAPWTAQTNATFDGVDAAQGGINLNTLYYQASYLNTRLTGPGTLTFWWKSSDTYANPLLASDMLFTLDSQYDYIYGNTPWRYKQYGITDGTHDLSWFTEYYAYDYVFTNYPIHYYQVDQVGFSVPTPVILATRAQLSTNVGALLRITNGMSFSVNLFFEASTTSSNGPFSPAYDVYDQWHIAAHQTSDPGSANSSFSGAFYYGYAPTIASNPVSVGTMAGSNITLRVAATGLMPLKYQWLRDEVPIVGETNSTLAFPDVQYNGNYRVAVMNEAGSVTSQVAVLMVTNTPGYQIKPPSGADLTIYGLIGHPEWTPAGGATWIPLTTNLIGGNMSNTALLTVTWKDSQTNDIVRSVWLLHVPSTSYTLGQEILPPQNVDITKQPTVSGTSLFWHRARNKLYAVSPGSAKITWYTTNNAPVTVDIDNSWPASDATYQFYIAGSPPVSLSNTWIDAQAKLLSSEAGSGVDANIVESKRTFQAFGVGNNMLLLCQGNPDTNANIYFQFVKSVRWSDLSYLHDHAPATIGNPITNHYGYHSAGTVPVHVPNRLTHYCTNFFIPGDLVAYNIIPVNRDRTDTIEDDFVLVFYAYGTNLLDVSSGHYLSSSNAWPHKAVRYDCHWPVDAPTITIASEKGSGPLNLDSWEIYVQNDTNQPGFNPNDEHALKLAARAAPAGLLPRLRVEPQSLMVQEGATDKVAVWLTSQPPTNVIVNIYPGARDLSLTTTNTTLQFTPTNWYVPQYIAFNAAPDLDDTNGIRVFTLQASGGVSDMNYVRVQEADTNRLGLVFNALSFAVTEGTNHSFLIHLTQRPATNVLVTISTNLGESSLSIEGTNTLVFTTNNWSTNQAFTLRAASDEDVGDEFQMLQIGTSGELTNSYELMVTALDADRGPYAVYPLRDDLGDAFGATNSITSEPYVLITYTNRQRGGVQVFRVVAEDDNYKLHYAGQAGAQIQPPYPLSDYVKWANSSGTNGPWWRDRKQVIWAKAAGDNGGPTNLTMRFFYRFQSNYFYYADGARRTNNAPVAWLDQKTGIPVNVNYDIKWPDTVNDLRVGETLVTHKNYLPDIDSDAKTSVAVVYQQAEAQGVGTSVQLIDYQHEYVCTNLTTLPADIVKAETATRVYFPTLPAHLRSRIWYEVGPPGSLHFTGSFEPVFGSVEEPVGCVLLNVLTERDKAYLLALSSDSAFQSAIQDLAAQAAQPLIVQPNDVFYGLALTAGAATGTGYVTLAYNNAVREPQLSASRGTPVELKIIRVTCPKYVGATKVIYSDDPFDEKVSLRHTGDFAGQADRYQYRWQYCQGSLKPGTSAAWIDVQTIPDTGNGALDIVVPGTEGNNLRTLVDGWYRCSYRPITTNCPCESTWSDWTDSALVEGWSKRVTTRINPFDQTFTNLLNQRVETLISIIGKAGARWTGDVPFDINGLSGKGLIEIYESVLRRGVNLSIEAVPPVQSDPDASKAILRVARKLADLYMVLGNEAYADAADPTIGFGTDGQYGAVASSIYCFMNQVTSLIDEELALLRGLDNSSGGTVATRYYPVYNRLYWNFTQGTDGGQVAYALNYNIQDTSGNVPSSVSLDTARTLYPQGHGDAWGHYLTAAKCFYRLLRNTNFVWSSEPESVSLGSGPAIAVNYVDERKFAEVAVAKARTGMEIVSLTYRKAYVDDPSGQWQGYLDGDTNRAWGVSEWASRAGQGTIFDWVTGNSLLPANSTNVGLAKVDRSSVTGLRELVSEYENIQQQVDKADAGLNPLGLAKNVLPFDLDAQKVQTHITQFEQVYERAVLAMNNAITVFNAAANCTQLLRRQADEFGKFQQTVTERDADFNSRLIEVFGTPYTDDIGPSGSYPTGYKGPDIKHYMLTDQSAITGENTGAAVPFSLNFVDTQVSTNGTLTQVSTPVTFYLAANGLGLVKNPSWTGQRSAPGKIQSAHSDLLQAKSRFDKALKEYDDLIEEIESQAALLEAIYQINANEIQVLRDDKKQQDDLNDKIYSARSRQEKWALASRSASAVANALAEMLPKSVGFSVDATSVARGGIMLAGAAVSEGLMYQSTQESLYELDQQQAKELAQAEQNIQVTTARQDQGILTQLAQLQQLVRKESQVRLEVYSQQEAMQQMAGNYRSVLASGVRLIDDQLRFKNQTAANVQQARYKDMAFRIFRNEALQKYRAQFDLASVYVYLAAKAYDYETNLRPGDPAGPGAAFISQIVRARTIGAIENGIPQTGSSGDGGLADVMARMSANFVVLKPQLGLNNPQETALSFSLRSEFLRIGQGASNSANWRQALQNFRVNDLNNVAEFMQNCQFENSRSEPGLVIPLPSTINKDMNFFGWPYGPNDNKFNETASSIKIYSVGISFLNYRTTGSGGMANTPLVYLVPVGNDVLRCPRSTGDTNRFTRVWKVLDQCLPVPFDLSQDDGSQLNNPNYIPAYSVGQGQGLLGEFREFAAFNAWHDSLPSSSLETAEQYNPTFLISRSVWNTKWLLVIPASGLGSDYDEALNRFIYGALNSTTGQRDGGVSDIKLRIKGYWYTGR
jgi:hypothetical protein